MARKCSVAGCRNTQWEKKKNQTKISFHQLPTVAKCRKAWLNRIKLLNNQNFPQNGIINSDHFDQKDLIEGKSKSKLLVGAMPIIFPAMNEFEDLESIIDANDTDFEMDACSTDNKENEVQTFKLRCPSSKLVDNVRVPKRCFLSQEEIDKPNITKAGGTNDEPVTPKRRKFVGSDIDEIDSHTPSTIETESKIFASTVTETRMDNEKIITPQKSKFVRYPGDIDENQLYTPKTARKYLSMCKKKIKSQSSIVYKLRQKVRLQKKQILDLKSLTSELKKKYGLYNHAKESIDSTFQDDIIQQLKVGRKTNSYCDNVKSFALTLNFYSNAAYGYLRRTFGNHLPSTKTLYNWYKNINGDPGISAEGLSILKSKVDDFKKDNKKLYVALMTDEMAIRSQLIWNATKKKYIGYVDYGLKNDDNDSTEEATQALVFMVVPINSSGKLPIAYYLTNKFSGEEQADITKNILNVVHETGAEVVSFTFDGATQNIAMSKALGADVDAKCLGSSFIHPCTQRPIHVFLDICHMLKLVRNNWSKGEIFYDAEGNQIKWNYIVELEKIQREQGLTLGTKVTWQHINFQNNKMKVKLAAQLLSNSVADALEYCESRFPQFKDCKATIKFIRLFNDLFDALNSRSFKGKGYKYPLHQHNEKKIFDLFETAEKYIKQLYIMVPTKKKNVVTLSKRISSKQESKEDLSDFCWECKVSRIFTRV